ncbi:MAG: cupin domain-containing protein [Gaiellaceae bacterium]
MASGAGDPSELIFLPGESGRVYQAGPMRAIFKADGTETGDAYSVSEWWLDAGDPGPGPHAHEQDVELFYVIEGTMSFLAGDQWVDAERAAFLRVPAGMTHDFENRSDARAGILNVSIPGGFESMMPRIVSYFEERDQA